MRRFSRALAGRILFFALALCGAFLFAPAAHAQNFTTVTVCVTDPNGLPYSYGTISAILTPATPGGYTLGGQPYSGQLPLTALDQNGCANGQGGISMGSNAAILPAGSQWLFTVGTAGVAKPIGTGPQSFTVTITISGASQTISATVSASAPKLASLVSGNSVSPNMSTVTVSRSCGAIPNCTTIVGDMNFDVDATFTAASPTVTTSSAAPAFVSASVPNQVGFGTFNCNSGNEANCTNNCPQSTMTFVSAHVVTLSNNCTNNSSATAHSNIFVWCTDDGAALKTAFNQMFTSGGNSAQTQELDIPAGGMCMGNNALVAPTPTGPRQNPIILRGHNTEIVPLPNMNCNASQFGNVGLVDMGFANNALGNIGSSDAAYDITFWGGGTSDKGSSAIYTNPCYGIQTHYGENFYNVWIVGWVWNHNVATPVYGWDLDGSQELGSGDYAGGTFGALCQGFNGAPTSIFGGNWGAGNANAFKITGSSGDGGCNTHGVYLDQKSGAGASNPNDYGVQVTAGTYRDFGSEGGIWVGGGDAWLNGTMADGFTATDDVHVAGGTLSLSNVMFTSHIEQSAGTLIFIGGNHAAGTTAPFVNPQFQTMTGGSAVAYQSVKGTCTGTVPASATSGGLYGTGSNITSTVCATIGGTTVGAGEVMQAAGTMGMLQVAAGTGGSVAGSGVFTVLKNGSTTTITCTVGTATSCVDVTHYVAYAVGDLISIQYTSQAADTLANIKASVMTAF